MLLHLVPGGVGRVHQLLDLVVGALVTIHSHVPHLHAHPGLTNRFLGKSILLISQNIKALDKGSYLVTKKLVGK